MAKRIDEIRAWAKENVSYKEMLPETKGLTINKTIKDILEPFVDEKFYMSEEKTMSLIEKLTSLDTKIIDVSQMRREGKIREYDTIAPTLAARDYKEPRMVGMIDIRGNESIRRVYDPNGLAPTLTTMGGGHREPKIVVAGNVNPSGRGMNGQVYKIENALSPTLSTNKGEGPKIIVNEFKKEAPRYRIRKLTPLECWRLQGFSDESFRKAEAVNSNSQLYKQAGNSVTVNVVDAIIRNI